MFEKGSYANFIASFPEKAGAMDVKDFRPINLMGRIYKILAIVLENRLKNVCIPMFNSCVRHTHIYTCVHTNK
jgi:hypothetical protein